MDFHASTLCWCLEVVLGMGMLIKNKNPWQLPDAGVAVQLAAFLDHLVIACRRG